MNSTARMPSVVSSSTSSSPGKTWYGYQDPGKSVVVDDRSEKPDRPSPAGYSKSDYDRSWSSQEWKSEVTAHDRSRKPDKTSWNAVQQVCPHHGDALLDGNAHSIRYGEMIHDGSGKPETVDHQKEANSENFVMGSDAAEFVDKVKDQVRNRQKRNHLVRVLRKSIDVSYLAAKAPMKEQGDFFTVVCQCLLSA